MLTEFVHMFRANSRCNSVREGSSPLRLRLVNKLRRNASPALALARRQRMVLPLPSSTGKAARRPLLPTTECQARGTWSPVALAQTKKGREGPRAVREARAPQERQEGPPRQGRRSWPPAHHGTPSKGYMEPGGLGQNKGGWGRARVPCVRLGGRRKGRMGRRAKAGAAGPPAHHGTPSKGYVEPCGLGQNKGGWGKAHMLCMRLGRGRKGRRGCRTTTTIVL